MYDQERYLEVAKKLKNITTYSRKVLEMPECDEKIICFIAEWEPSKIRGGFGIEENRDYVAAESYIFSEVREDFLQSSQLSFLAYRKFAERNEEIGHNLKKIAQIFKASKVDLMEKLTREQRAYNRIKEEHNKLVDNQITVLGETKENEIFVDAVPTIEIKKTKVLCLDYITFGRGILPNFLNYFENINNKHYQCSKELEALFELFNDVSVDVKFESMLELGKMIVDAFENKLELRDYDRLEYLSSNHLQNIKQPWFWRNSLSETDGYLCKYNQSVYDKKNKNNYGIEDNYRFFYSFESLLCWELKNCLKKARRCESCGGILPLKMSAKRKYCDKTSPNYAECTKKRTRDRQQKFYDKNLKT